VKSIGNIRVRDPGVAPLLVAVLAILAGGPVRAQDAQPEPAAPPPPVQAPPPSGVASPFPVPAILDGPSPAWPQAALDARSEGNAVLELGLDANGVVTEVSVLVDPGKGLGEAAAAALRQSIFESPPAEGPEHALRRYFYVQRWRLPAPAPGGDDGHGDGDGGADGEPGDAGAEPPEAADELTALPALIEQPEAEYPAAAREAGVQARIELELDVSEGGEMDAVRLLEAEPRGWGFELAAVRAAWRFRFQPAMAGPVAVPVRITYTYRFTLEERVVEKEAPEGAAPAVAGGGGAAAVDAEGPVNLSGYVRERGSRRPLASVDVVVEDLQHGVLSDESGWFEFHGLPPGLHRVLVVAPGYEKFETEEDILPGKATEVVYFVRESPTGIPETIVRVQAEKKEVARRSISIETIERIPGTFGDPVKVVQNLPGVARAPFDFGLLLVRGSGPEDSGAHIDGIRVPQLFHFGAFRSIVTPILLDSVDFYPGGYGVTYGRLTGGILDVKTRDRYEDVLHGLVQADLLDASAAILGPIKKKGEKQPIGGFVLAARRSYLDVVLPALAPSTVDLSRIIFPRWNDIQGKLTLRPHAHHTLSWLAYYSQDKAGTRVEDPALATNDSTQGDFSVRTDFWRAQVDWGFRPGPKISNRFLFAVGQDIQDYKVGQFADVYGDAFWWMLRDEANLQVDEHLSILLGADTIAAASQFTFEFANFDVRTFGSDPNAEREELKIEDRPVGIAPAFFAEARVKLADERIRLNPGLRFDAYTVEGNFSFATLDPRMSFRLTPDPDKRIDVKGSLGIYHQNPQGYEILDSTGNTDLKPEESYQFTLGGEFRFTDFLSLDVQGFYKRLTRLVVFNSGSVAEGGSDAAWTNSGDGHIWGGEIFLRWEAWKNFEGWIALTLQRSQRRDHADWDFYWYDFDQPVILDIVASYRLPYGFRIGARWRYVSGNPQTPILDSIYDADSDGYIPLSGEYNSDRLPDFHALDIRLDKDFNFRRWKLTFYVDVMNVYNRKNPEATIYNFDYTEKTWLYGLPIIPNLGFKAQF
jgi:TonB family protein